MKSFFDFDLCNNVRFRKQINKHVKKRKIREKHRKRIFFFRRFKSFSRKFIFIVDKQFVKKHNFIQYIHDMNNVDKNYDVSFSTRRFTKNIFSLKNSLRNQQLTFCKILQHEITNKFENFFKKNFDQEFLK